MERRSKSFNKITGYRHKVIPQCVGSTVLRSK